MKIEVPRRILAALTALALLAAAAPALCFDPTTTSTGLVIRWPGANAGFYFNAAGAPSGALAAVQAAMNTWTAVPTSSFSFNYLGTSLSIAYGANDGKNIISFGSIDDANTLALNTFWYDDNTGELMDSDIRFDTGHSWATNGSATAFDVQTTALHELGHALSLDDLEDSAKVMYKSSYMGEIKRSLTQDDKNGITYIYPNGSGTTTTTIPVDLTEPCPAEYVLGEHDADLAYLREFRDRFLEDSAAGRLLVRLYYDHQEGIKSALAQCPALQETARSFFRTAARVMKRRR